MKWVFDEDDMWWLLIKIDGFRGHFLLFRCMLFCSWFEIFILYYIMFSVSISVTPFLSPFELNCVVYCRWTFLRQRRHTARARSAGSTPCIRLHSTRRARIVLLLRESAAMTASNLVMEDRPNQSSTKRSNYNVHLRESMLRKKVMES